MATTIDGSGITTPEISAGNIVGEICFFGMTTPPAGFLKCNGAAISRTTYAALFAAIGTTWGSGDGATTFNIPDLRGEFLRCWDDGRGVDSGRAFGGFQSENWKGFYMTNTQQGLSSGYSHNDVDMGKSTTSYVGKLFTGAWNNPSAAIGTRWNAWDEVRPRNGAALACIKY